MLTSTYTPAILPSSNACGDKRPSSFLCTGLHSSPIARRLFHFASNRRRASRGCLTAIAQLPQFQPGRQPSAAFAARLQSRAVLDRVFLGDFGQCRGAVASMKVLPGEALPGELLVQASEAAVVTSTLVLGCLFSMLGAQPEAPRPKANGDPRGASAGVHRGARLLAGAPTSAPSVAAAAAFAPSVLSSSAGNSDPNGDSNVGSGSNGTNSSNGGAGGRSDKGDVGGQACGSQSTGAPVEPAPEDLGCGGSIGQDNSNQGVGGGLGRSFAGRGFGDDGGRSEGLGGGGAARDGYGGGGGRRDGFGGGGGWPGFGSGGADDGGAAPSSRIAFALCIALGTAAALLTQKADRLLAGPRDPKALRHRLPLQLHELTAEQPMQQRPPPLDAKEGKESLQRCTRQERGLSEMLEEQQAQQQWERMREHQSQQQREQQQEEQQQQQSQREQQPIGVVKGMVAQINGSARLSRGRLTLADVAAGAAAAASGVALRIYWRDFGSGRCTRSHSIGVGTTAAAASLAHLDGPWPGGFPTLELDPRGGYPSGGSQLKPKQPAAAPHTQPGQRGARRPSYGVRREGDVLDSDCDRGQQTLRKPARQQVDHQGIQQQGARSGPRGSDAGSDRSSRGRSNHVGSGGGSSAAKYPPERHAAEAHKPLRKGLVVGRETLPSYFHGYRGGQQTPSAPAWPHGEQPGMQQPVATRPGPRGCDVRTDTSQSHSNQGGSDLGASGRADRTHERRKVEIPQPVRSGLVFGHDAPSGDDYGAFSKQQPLPARQQHERPEVQQTATRPAPPVCGVGSGGGSSQGSSADIQDCTLERADTDAPRSVRRGLVRRETSVGSLEGCSDGQTPSAPTWPHGEQPRTPQLATRPGPRGCDVGHGRRHDGSHQGSSHQGSNGDTERTPQHHVAEKLQPARRALVLGHRGAPSGDDYSAFAEQQPLPATQQALPDTQQYLPAKQKVEVPTMQQQGARSGPRGSDAGSDSSSRGRSILRTGLVVGRETPSGIGIELLQRRRGRAQRPGGPESVGSPLPPQSAVAVPVPVPASVQAPTQRPMAALRPELAPAPEPRLADKAVEAPGRTALTVAVAPFPSSRGPVDVGRAVSAVCVRCPPGGGAGGLAAVSLCDEIAALETVQRGLDGAQRRADLWLAAGVPGLPGAAATAAVAHT